MKKRLAAVLIILACGGAAIWLSRTPSTPKVQIEAPAQTELSSRPPAPEPVSEEHVAPVISARPPQAIHPVAKITAPAPTTNKLERLAQVREQFHNLAAGDPTSAMRAAKELPGTERET